MKQKKLTDFFEIKKFYGYNKEKDTWHCLKCGVNMGTHNPRQYCGKTYCLKYCDEE